ncbi:peroxiredoxin [Agromyces sp. H3Y2-19a]|jgi:peroxiredoxin|uniref:peroxiredoxin n=1 Tax=Agromyces TaxID=33877 RepID=UPI001E2D01C0|nr:MULTISPECIES: peroxiredoxin [Agromyces]MCD5347248.1 peroxiredoxin [Agromyces sp. S2-1-8]MDF0513292.1 peroxiredoxin [Agromyces chromiiresistens]
MILAPGAVAPDFDLVDQHGQTVRLADFRGRRPVVLVFFPLAFSGICQGELCELRDNFAMFADESVELIGVSVDSKHTLRAWSEAQGYGFRLLADFWPHGEVAAAYGAFDAEHGVAARATFLIDDDGVVVDSFATPKGEARPLERYREALASLRRAA